MTKEAEPFIAGESAPTPADSAQTDPRFRTDELIADMKGRSVRGGVAIMIGQGIKFVLRTGSTIVLARLLTPADFGLVAMAAAITGFVDMFKEAGLSMATVQRDHITHEQVSMLFWINVGLSALLMLATAAAAPLIAWFYGEPRLIPITLVLASTFVFGGLAVQHQALLRRQMRFGQLTTIKVCSMAAGIGAAITLAALTNSYWSLVLMHAVSAVTAAVGVWLASGWIPGMPRRGTGVMPMLKFGGNVTGYNTVNYFARNMDNVLIGWWWGAAPLGLYSKAYGLLMLPVAQMDKPVSSVMMPALSRVQNQPNKYRRLYFRAIEALTWLGVPGITILALNAHVLVLLVLGEQWVPVAPLFQLLAPAAVVSITSPATGWAVVPRGRADRYFRLSIFTGICTVVAIVIGLPFGLAGVAVAISVSRLLIELPALHYSYQGTNLKLKDFIACFVKPLLLSVGIGAIHLTSVAILPLETVTSKLALMVVECLIAAGVLLSIKSMRSLIRLMFNRAR